MNRHTRLRASSIALAIVMAAAVAACGKAPAPETPVRAVRTLVLSGTGGLQEREFAGEVRARTESRLGFRVSGKVNRRLVELGQTVKQGQPLAQLDSQDLFLGEQAAKAGLAAAEANAAQAEADLKRFTELREQGFISDAELERRSVATRSALASAQQAKAQAGVQANQTRYATLVAEAAGVITSVELEPGQVVAAGQPVLTLAHDGPRDVVFAVPEDQGKTVKSLQGRAGAVQVRRWGSSDWVPATIREVAASTDPLTRTYLVKADVGSQGLELGQTASVRLSLPVQATQGVHVPIQAVAEQGGRSVVWVLDANGMTVQPVPVTTDAVLGDVVLVTQGLRPGQEIVTAGAHVLTSGQKVRRYQAEGETKPAVPVPASAAPAASAAKPAKAAKS